MGFIISRMKRFYKIVIKRELIGMLVIFLRFLAFSIIICITTKVYAYRPLGTEDASVAEKGVTQLELSWDYLRWGKDKEYVFLAVPVYGVTENLEISFEIPYLIHRPIDESNHNGLGDINIVVKYILTPEKEKNPALAFKGVIKLNNGDFDKGLGSGDIDYSLFIVVSKTYKNLLFHGHLGYTFVGNRKIQNLRNIYIYGIAFDYGFSDSFHILGEINGNRHPDRNEPKEPRSALLGIAYKLSEKITFDTAIKRSLTSSAPDWGVTIGASINF